jgi:hypothetical protein
MRSRVTLSVLVLVLVVWLGTGWLFAWQHGYLDEDSCSTGWDNATTVLLGPLSYVEPDTAWGMCNIPV